MLTNTGAQQAGRVVGHFAQLLLDRLIDDRSAGNGGLHRLAALVLAIAVQHAGQHLRQSVFAVLAGLLAIAPGRACLLTGLGGLLGGFVRLSQPIGAGLVLRLILLLAGLLTVAFLALGFGCGGILLLLLAGTGLLISRLFGCVFLGACFGRLVAFRLVGGLCRLV